MLILLPTKMKKLPIEHALPYNENDLMIVMSPDVAFVIKEIQNDRGEKFSIKHHIEENKIIFGNPEFEKRCSDFAEIFDARIERVFVTNKSDYMFFDQEEQKSIKEVFTNNSLSGMLDVLIMKNGKFRPSMIEDMTMLNFQKVRPFLRKLNATYILHPDLFVRMNLAYKRSEEKKKKNFIGKQKEEVSKIFEKYPELNVNTKQEFKEAYRKLAKACHPDSVPGGDGQEFKKLGDAVNRLRKSKWYKRMQ